MLAPQLVDEPVGRDDLARMDQQQAEERALLLPAERDRPGPVLELERTEDPELCHTWWS